VNQHSKLSVIIPTFNRYKITRGIIHQLQQQDFPGFQIIVSDSGSTDGTQDLGKEFPEIVILNVGANKWWSGAINEGILYAQKIKSNLLLIINDDLIIPDNLIGRMMEYHQEYPETLITTAQLELSGLIYVGSQFKGVFRERVNIRNLPNKVINIDCSNGCCMLIPAKIFEKIGLVDEDKIPHIGGDLNIYLRAQKFGYQCIAVPDLLIKQTSHTDYTNKFSARTILNHPGSAMHFKTYLYNGNALYNSWGKFIFLGIKNHFIYIKTLVIILIKLSGASKLK
jgi:GT2 family glycosyltransferase